MSPSSVAGSTAATELGLIPLSTAIKVRLLKYFEVKGLSSTDIYNLLKTTN